MVVPLLILVSISVVNQFLLYASVMYWPTTTCSAMMLVAPLLSLMLAYIFLKETASRSELAFLTMTLIGAAIIVWRPTDEQLLEKKQPILEISSAPLLAYLLLIGEPFCRASGQILTRHLRALGPQTCSFYTSLVQIPVLFAASHLLDIDLHVYRSFN